MSPLALTLLILQSVFFVAWAFLTFRAVFGIHGRHRRATGRQWIGPIEIFSVCAAYLRDPAQRRELRLILVAFALIAQVTVLFVLVQAPPVQ